MTCAHCIEEGPVKETWVARRMRSFLLCARCRRRLRDSGRLPDFQVNPHPDSGRPCGGSGYLPTADEQDMDWRAKKR
jgi:hypothetical protein